MNTHEFLNSMKNEVKEKAMKKAGIIFFMLVITLTMVFPVSAKKDATTNWESKSASAIWEYTELDGITY